MTPRGGFGTAVENAHCDAPRSPSCAGRNCSLLTAAAVVTGVGPNGSLAAAAFAVLYAGGDGADAGLVAASRTVPRHHLPTTSGNAVEERSCPMSAAGAVARRQSSARSGRGHASGGLGSQAHDDQGGVVGGVTGWE